MCARGGQSLNQGIFLKHSPHYFLTRGLLLMPEWLDRKHQILLSLSDHAHMNALLCPAFYTHWTKEPSSQASKQMFSYSNEKSNRFYYSIATYKDLCG